MAKDAGLIEANGELKVFIDQNLSPGKEVTPADITLSISEPGSNAGNLEEDENSSSQLGADQDASCTTICLLQLLGLKLGPAVSKTG